MIESIIWIEKKNWFSKSLYLSLEQLFSGWSVVDGVISSRYFHQKKITIPVGLSRREIADYIHHHQAQLMQLDSTDYCFRHLSIHHDKQKNIDALWCMALKKSYVNDATNNQRNCKRVVCHLVCDWQHTLNQIWRHYQKNTAKNHALVCCYGFQNSTVFLGMIKDCVIHLDIIQKEVDRYWVEQQVDLFKLRSNNDMKIDYKCSQEFLDTLATNTHDNWQVLDKGELLC